MRLTLSIAVLTIGVASAAAVDSGALSQRERNADLTEAREMIEGGRYPAAIEILLALVEDDPTSADAHNLLGYSHRKSGDPRSAEGYYLKALQLDPLHLEPTNIWASSMSRRAIWLRQQSA